MGMPLDWEAVKREVDIEQYFLHKLGDQYAFDKYKQAYILATENGNGDIIRFFHHRDTGVKMYYSMKFHDGGDIIQFIKKRIFLGQEVTPQEINAEINAFCGSFIIPSRYSLPATQSIVPERDSEPAKFLVKGSISNNIIAHLDYLTRYRNISAATIYAPEFNDILFDYTYGSSSLAFYLRHVTGELAGINRIQTADGEFFNKKWFEKGSTPSTAFTFSNTPIKYLRLCVCESIFDAMAYQEIYEQSHIQYISTNGETGFSKARLVAKYFHRHKFEQMILANDSDIPGNIFNLTLLCAAIRVVENVKRGAANICINMKPKSSQDLTKIRTLTNFFVLSETKEIPELDMQFPQAYFENISNGGTEYSFLIQNNLHSVQFFVGLLINIWQLEEKVLVHQPKNKDFNEDLKEFKIVKHG